MKPDTYYPVPVGIIESYQREFRDCVLNNLQADIMSGLMDNMSLKNMCEFRKGNYWWREKDAPEKRKFKKSNIG